MVPASENAYHLDCEFLAVADALCHVDLSEGTLANGFVNDTQILDSQTLWRIHNNNMS